MADDDEEMRSAGSEGAPGRRPQTTRGPAGSRSPNMLAWAYGNRVVAGRSRTQRAAAAVADARRLDVLHERLKIVHYTSDHNGKDGIDYKAVARHFGKDPSTIMNIWRIRDNLFPHAPGPSGTAPAPELAPVPDRVIDVVFHPPRKTDAQTPSVAVPATTTTSPEAAVSSNPAPTLSSTLIGVVNSATHTLCISVSCFADDELGEAVLAAAKRRVHVRLYVDYKQAYEHPKWIRKFINCDLIEVNYRRAKMEKMHTKYLVADGEQVVVGSADFSTAALREYNEEVLVHICGRRAASLFLDDFQYRWLQGSKCLCRRTLQRPTLG